MDLIVSTIVPKKNWGVHPIDLHKVFRSALVCQVAKFDQGNNEECLSC